MNNFIKLTCHVRCGYHPSDPNANSANMQVNIEKLDYYYDEDDKDGYASMICINGHEFRCKESVTEITEKIELEKIADSVK